MIYKAFIIFLMMSLYTNTWAESWVRTISPKEDVAEFCFQVAKDNSLDLKIKRNIDIELPLIEIEKIIEYNEKWYPEIDLFENYEIKFPEEWKCQTLIPLWYIKTFDELQVFFKNKIKSKLSNLVSHNCKIKKNIIDNRELEGNYILKIEKSSKKIYGFQFTYGNEKSTYKYTKGFKAKVVGRCPDKKQVK